MAKVTNASFEEVSKLIITAIEEEQFFNKDVLVPKVRAILKAFKINLTTANFNKLESPSESAKRLLSLERTELEKNFWKQKVKELAADKMDEYYKQVDDLRRQHGFEVK